MHLNIPGLSADIFIILNLLLTKVDEPLYPHPTQTLTSDTAGILKYFCLSMFYLYTESCQLNHVNTKKYFKNCRFGPSHHRLRSHMMFISMQHVLLWVGWEVDGVNLNAMLVFTLADLQFLFATCKPHPPSNRMLISPFPAATPASEHIPVFPYITGMGCAHTQKKGLCNNNFQLLNCLHFIWLSAACLFWTSRFWTYF